jgi:hypothetical protein
MTSTCVLAGVERVDDGCIAFFDHVAAQLARARDLAVVGVELLVQVTKRRSRSGSGSVALTRCTRLAHQLDHLGFCDRSAYDM